MTTHSHVLEESTDQNLPHDSDLDEDKLLGLATNISIPGGHSDDLHSPHGLPKR